MKRFLQTVGKSVYGPEWYRSVLDQSFGKALVYLLGLVTLITLCWAVFFIVVSVPFWSAFRSEADAFHGQVIDVFPEALVLSFSDGQLSTNMPEPYAVPLPEAWKWVFQDEGQHVVVPRNLVVFDTTKLLDRADFANQDTIVLVSRTEIGFYNPAQEKTEIRSFAREISDGSLDKATYTALINAVWSWLWKMAPFFILLLIPIVIVAIVVGNLMYLVFGALVVWLAAVIVGKRLSYVQAYKSGMYLLTFSLVLSPIFSWIPFFTTLSLFVLALLNFRSPLEKKPQSIKNESLEDEKPKGLPEVVLVEESK